MIPRQRNPSVKGLYNKRLGSLKDNTFKNIPDKKGTARGDWLWVFPFGRYKGKTVGEVMDMNPGYIIWANDNGAVSFPAPVVYEARSREEEGKKRKYFEREFRRDLDFSHDEVEELGFDEGRQTF